MHFLLSMEFWAAIQIYKCQFLSKYEQYLWLHSSWCFEKIILSWLIITPSCWWEYWHNINLARDGHKNLWVFFSSNTAFLTSWIYKEQDQYLVCVNGRHLDWLGPFFLKRQIHLVLTVTFKWNRFLIVLTCFFFLKIVSCCRRQP